MELTPEDREALIEPLRTRPLPGVEWFNQRDAIVAAVEAILCRHVEAALSAAADACDRKATEWAAEYADTNSDADYGRWDAWENAARIVRALPQTSPPP